MTIYLSALTQDMFVILTTIQVVWPSSRLQRLRGQRNMHLINITFAMNDAFYFLGSFRTPSVSVHDGTVNIVNIQGFALKFLQVVPLAERPSRASLTSLWFYTLYWWKNKSHVPGILYISHSQTNPEDALFELQVGKYIFQGTGWCNSG